MLQSWLRGMYIVAVCLGHKHRSLDSLQRDPRLRVLSPSHVPYTPQIVRRFLVQPIKKRQEGFNSWLVLGTPRASVAPADCRRR